MTEAEKNQVVLSYNLGNELVRAFIWLNVFLYLLWLYVNDALVGVALFELFTPVYVVGSVIVAILFVVFLISLIVAMRDKNKT